MAEYVLSYTLNGKEIGLISPRVLLKEVLLIAFSSVHHVYTPTNVIRDNYIKSYELIGFYSKWILKEYEYYVGKRGFNMARDFLLRKQRLDKRFKEFTREELLNRVYSDILSGMRLPVLHVGQFLEPRKEAVYHNPAVELLLGKTISQSEKVRSSFIFKLDDPFESEKLRKPLIFDDWEEWLRKKELFFSGKPLKEGDGNGNEHHSQEEESIKD